MKELECPIYDEKGRWGIHKEFHDFLKLWAYNATKNPEDKNARVPYYAKVYYRDLLALIAPRKDKYPVEYRSEIQYKDWPEKGKNGEHLCQKIITKHPIKPRSVCPHEFQHRWNLDQMELVHFNSDYMRPLIYDFVTSNVHQNYEKFMRYERILYSKIGTKLSTEKLRDDHPYIAWIESKKKNKNT